MDADGRRKELDVITRRIIGCAFTVGRKLGCGFLEKVYENALALELKRAGLTVEQQKGLDVYYDDVVVGRYEADLLVEECVLVELKAVKAFDEIHMAPVPELPQGHGFAGVPAHQLRRPQGRDQAHRQQVLRSASIRVHRRFLSSRAARR
jgi:GxxExxY protein